MRHNAHTVGQVVSFLNVLGAQNNRSVLSDFKNKIPDLTARLDIES
jgi:hypothetical protein